MRRRPERLSRTGAGTGGCVWQRGSAAASALRGRRGSSAPRLVHLLRVGAVVCHCSPRWAASEAPVAATQLPTTPVAATNLGAPLACRSRESLQAAYLYGAQPRYKLVYCTSPEGGLELRPLWWCPESAARGLEGSAACSLECYLACCLRPHTHVCVRPAQAHGLRLPLALVSACATR